MVGDQEDERYYRVREDPTEYALWLEFRKGGDLYAVSAEEVPALVRAGKDVWSFGYGWDQGELEPGEYTTIDEGDLDWFDMNTPEGRNVVDSWGPFAVEP